MFKAAYNSIMPEFYYKEDVIKTSPHKRKLLALPVVNKFWQEHLPEMRDHVGNVVTKSGSKYDGISKILKQPKPRLTRHHEPKASKVSQLQKQNTRRTQQSIEMSEDDSVDADEIFDELNKEWNSLSRSPTHRKGDSRHRFESCSSFEGPPGKQPSATSFVQLFKRQQSSLERKGTQHSNHSGIKDHMTSYFNMVLAKDKKNDGMMKQFYRFQSQLEHQLETDSEGEDGDEDDEEFMQEKFFSSQFNK